MPTESAEDDLVGITDAEQITKRSRRSLRRLIADGALPYVTKMPGRTGAYVFRRSDLEALAKDDVAA